MSHLDYVKDVEEALKQLGADPKDAKASLPGSWIVKKGSASITITLNSSPGAEGEQNTISMNCRLMDVPRRKQREFFRRLLELNHSFISERFELFDEGVFLSAVRHLEGLATEEVIAMINDISETADFWDDKLIAEFM
ncbi:MAG: YbjN domain-containing protein [Bacteroidota bacterium]